MSHPRPDQQFNVNAQFLRGFVHTGTGNQLSIVFSTVSTYRDVRRVQRVIDGVVDSQVGVLPRWSLFLLFLVFVEIDKSSAGADRRPHCRMVQPQVPCSSPAHRESVQRHAIVVDAKSSSHVGDRFEDVRFSSPAISVVASTVHIKLNPRLLLRQIFAFMAEDEVGFVHVVCAAV